MKKNLIKNSSLKIVVTGGLGFMGSRFILELLSSPDFCGLCINVDAMTYAADPDHLKSVKNDPRYVFVHADICDHDKMKQVLGEYECDLIVHFAAESHVDNSIHDPFIFVKSNVYGTQSLLEAVRLIRPHAHFHHISTDEVYGTLSASESPFTESSPYHPRSPYSASKAASDHLVLAYSNTYQISVTISHACNNYGPHQHHEKLIPKMINRALDGGSLPLYGDGNQRREWLFVDDHARAIMAILDHRDQLLQKVINIPSSLEISNKELLHRLLKHLAACTLSSYEHLISLIQHVEDRPGHDFRYAMLKESVNLTKWQESVPFDEGIQQTIQYMIQKHEDKKVCSKG